MTSVSYITVGGGSTRENEKNANDVIQKVMTGYKILSATGAGYGVVHYVLGKE